MAKKTQTCSGCGKSISKDYSQCYACKFYGKRSYAQIRQAKTDVFEQNCVGCGESISEDSTTTHTCKVMARQVKSMPSIEQVRKSMQRKSRRAGKVRIVKVSDSDTFDSRKRTFPGF
jgi:wyosine [tRNA(Phe)-imidazoG37] synthetase (radical SAM superfamily)